MLLKERVELFRFLRKRIAVDRMFFTYNINIDIIV